MYGLGTTGLFTADQVRNLAAAHQQVYEDDAILVTAKVIQTLATLVPNGMWDTHVTVTSNSGRSEALFEVGLRAALFLTELGYIVYWDPNMPWAMVVEVERPRMTRVNEPAKAAPIPLPSVVKHVRHQRPDELARRHGLHHVNRRREPEVNGEAVQAYLSESLNQLVDTYKRSYVPVAGVPGTEPPFDTAPGALERWAGTDNTGGVMETALPSIGGHSVPKFTGTIDTRGALGGGVLAKLNALTKGVRM